jgi:N-acyl-D-amino-acid deacylase
MKRGERILVRGGFVVDGTGSPARRADVGIRDGRIEAIGEGLTCDRVLDAAGRVVCPGFIDMHTHSDLALIETPALAMKLAQGVTLEVLGQDGLSCAPVVDEHLELVTALIAPLDGETREPWSWRTVAQYLSVLEGRVAQNIAYLVPHGTVRACVLGSEEREATPSELERMAELVGEGIRDGAFGLSTGLSYPPAHASSTAEVTALARELPAHGGIYVTHLRSYADQLFEATEEALAIGRSAGVPVHFSHLQTPGRVNQGRAPEMLAILDGARDSGLDISFDVYPYESASTVLTAFLPPPIRFLPRRQAMSLLADPDARSDLVGQIDNGRPVGMDIEWTDLRVANGLDLLEGGDPRLAEIARGRGRTMGETIATLLELTECRASVVAAATVESDVTACLTHPLATIGSDGILLGERPHPRGFGTFPRYLRRAQQNGMGLEEAIATATGRAARRLGLRDRGTVSVGAAADLCILDPDAFADTATYDDPQLARGMDTVLVNGVVVWEKTASTGATPGMALRNRRARDLVAR